MRLTSGGGAYLVLAATSMRHRLDCCVGGRGEKLNPVTVLLLFYHRVGLPLYKGVAGGIRTTTICSLQSRHGANDSH